jgi:hypothetical protein
MGKVTKRGRGGNPISHFFIAIFENKGYNPFSQ